MMRRRFCLPVRVPDRRRPGLVASLVALAAAAALALPATPYAQTNEPAEEFSAFAINMGAYTRGTTATLVMTVRRWSSKAEQDQLFGVLREKGMSAMLDALRDTKSVGTIRTPESVGYDLHLAMQEPLKEGGRRVLLATDRPISFFEAVNRPPSVDYPFTVIEMNIPPEGKGQGTMSVAARIVPAGKTVLVENFDTQPVRLNEIATRKLD